MILPPLRVRAQNDIYHDISETYGRVMTKQGGRVGEVTITCRFELSSGQQIQTISGIQNVNCSAWQGYAPYRVLFQSSVKSVFSATTGAIDTRLSTQERLPMEIFFKQNYIMIGWKMWLVF